MRHLNGANSGQNNNSTASTKLINNTRYPVKLTTFSTGNTIYSCGNVTDNGATNSVSQIDCN